MLEQSGGTAKQHRQRSFSCAKIARVWRKGTSTALDRWQSSEYRSGKSLRSADFGRRSRFNCGHTEKSASADFNVAYRGSRAYVRVHRHSGVGPRCISAAIESYSLGKPEETLLRAFATLFSVDLSLKTGSDLGMSARVIQVRTATRRLRSLRNPSARPRVGRC